MNPTFKYLIRVFRSVSLCLLLCVSWGCRKYTGECELTVKPRRLVVASSPDNGSAHQVRIYAFYIGQGTKESDVVEARNWRPMSYSDAEAGIITNIYTGETRSTGLFAEQGDDYSVRLTLSSSPVVLVAVNAMDRYYAWRAFKYEIPMPRMEIVVRFLLYQSTAETPEYADADWRVTSEQYETGQ